MNGLRSRALRLVTVASLALLAVPTTSYADHIGLDVDLDAIEVTDGTVELRVVVRTASGQRLADAVVVAHRPASIAGVRGDVEIARSVSDELGIATLTWIERRAEPGPVVLAYAAPGESEFEMLELPDLDIVQTEQLERSSAGVEIPVLGVWVLIGLLVVVWGLVEYALYGTVRIAHEDRHEQAPDVPHDREEVPA